MRSILLALLISTMKASAQEAVVPDLHDQTGDFAGQFLCQATSSGGVALDRTTGKWNASSFNVAEDRFVLVLNAEGMDSAPGANGWGVTSMFYSAKISKLGEKSGSDCKSFEPEVGDRVRLGKTGLFRCDAGMEEYRFNLTEMRFQRYYGFGYVDGGGDTPNVTIGECAAF